MTFGQVVYIISDFSKTISDDSIINTDHILFLASKYRNYILNQYYASNKKPLSDANYQTICIDLERFNKAKFCGNIPVLRSKEKLPFVLPLGKKSIYPPAGFLYGNIQFVNNTKFKYMSENKYLKNTIYATIGPDEHLYLRANGSDFLFLKKVILSALFTDIEDAAKQECSLDGECYDGCDIMERNFPLDDSYMPLLMKMVVQDIVGAAWRPKDDDNNATDDLATFAQTLQMYTNNAFKRQATPQRADEQQQSQ